MSYTFTYDLNGIRNSKTVNGVTYNYLTQNGKVVRQTWTEDGQDKVMDFIYDNAGSPYALVYNGEIYYYILNQQGDAIRIVSPNGSTHATYTYNAWGKLMDCSGWLATTNPIRYRGYYCDSETGFYYLQSRYYDPAIGRFINADQFTSTGQGFVGHNMFTYCLNNPIIMGDNEGKDAVVLIDNEGANGFGHVGFLAQDSEGVWWHFYWGPSLKIPCLFGTVKETTWCCRYDGEISLDAINSADQYGDPYDKMMYYNGDFSNSVTQAKSYGKAKNYNLYSRNCSQVSFSLLAESPNDNQEVFRTASTKMIPKSAYKYTSQNRVRKNRGKVIAMTV